MKILQNCPSLVTLCLAVVFVWFPGNTLGISCYQCGAEDGESALSCDIFAKAPMWRQFEVECPASPRHVCGKTITHHDDATEPSEVRGCAPAENAFQVPNAMGCGRDDQTSQTVLCLCGTSLCNGASRSSLDSSMTTLFFSVAFLALSFTFYARLTLLHHHRV